MGIHSPEKEHDNNTEAEIGYQVFYSDSEDIAKMLAMSHIKTNMHRDLVPIERPDIRFKSYLFGLLFPFALYAFVTVLMIAFVNAINVWLFVAGYLTVFLFTAKPFVILCVLLYQKYAPARIRRSCCFEPTCSNYMLQAIEKYGFWRGFIKGIGRLCRCHHPNGGIDLP